MAVIVGFDIHRTQITYDLLDADGGEVRRGRMTPADRAHVRKFLSVFDGSGLIAALEATTGWRFVAEELDRIGAEVHLAEPAEAGALRGKKRRAKTDRTDARHLRELVMQGRLPESWVPPHDILELRSRVRLRKMLVDERTCWLQRINATLFHHGVAPSVKRLTGVRARGELGALDLPPAAVARIEVALAMVEHLNRQLHPLELELGGSLAPAQAVGRLWSTTGSARRSRRRSSASRATRGASRRLTQAVRYAGLDITVHQSDSRRRAGRLSRQGPPVLRWAVFEAAQTAARPKSPDHAYYLELKQRLGANRAALAIARKYVRRAHHTLRALGDEAVAATG